MFNAFDGDRHLHPAAPAVGPVWPAFGVFVHLRGGGRINLLHLAPRPRPREIGERAATRLFLLGVVADVDAGEGVPHAGGLGEDDVLLGGGCGDHRLLFLLLCCHNSSVINCSGVFIYYGYSSEVAFLNNLGIVNDKGYIDVDDNMKTNCDLVYACGDIINKELYQVSTAVSEGAIAAVSLNKELNGR